LDFAWKFAGNLRILVGICGFWWEFVGFCGILGYFDVFLAGNWRFSAFFWNFRDVWGWYNTVFLVFVVL